jgi:uncharacterized protein YqgV (UPF0045/DUF77 family)
VTITAEFTVEPFEEGSPGPHVLAALDAARLAGVDVDFGPFGTTMRASDDRALLDAVDSVLRAALAAGGTQVSLQVRREP